MDDDCNCEDCNCKPKEINLKELGPEAEELAAKFNELNDYLTKALETRHKILQDVHAKANQSLEMREKMDKVIQSRHPVLIQFVFGLE